MFLGGVRNRGDYALYYLIQLVLVVTGVYARKDIVKYRNLHLPYIFTFFLCFEYTVVGRSIINLNRRLSSSIAELVCTTLILWVIKFFIILINIVRVHRAPDDKIEKIMKQYHLMSWLFYIPILLVFLRLFLPLRNMEAETAPFLLTRPAYIMGIHLFFSLIYILFMDSVCYSLIFREEIAAELGGQRKAVGKKKANRRKLKRKEIE